MSCIRKDEVWKSLIGKQGTKFIVTDVTEDGWVNGVQAKEDSDGNLIVDKKTKAPEPMPGTSFASHHDTMKLYMVKIYP